MTRPRSIAALLCGAAVLALLLSVGVRDWWTFRGGEARIDVGLWSSQRCETTADEAAACAILPLAPDHVGFGRVARATWLAGAAAAALALVLGALALAGRESSWLGPATAFAGGLVAMLAIVVVALAPDALDAMPWGTGPAFALAGGACAVAAGLLVGRAPDRPAGGTDPDGPTGVPAWFIAGAAGLALVFLALHTRTWWSDENPTLVSSFGLRDEELCWKRDATDDAPAHLACEHDTYRMTSEGPFPDPDRGRKRACAIGFQLGHLLAIAGVLLLGFTVAGQRVPGAAPLVIVLALAFVIAAAIAAMGRPHPEASRSYGALLGLAGAALLFGTSLAISRVPRRARVYPDRR